MGAIQKDYKRQWGDSPDGKPALYERLSDE